MRKKWLEEAAMKENVWPRGSSELNGNPGVPLSITVYRLSVRNADDTYLLLGLDNSNTLTVCIGTLCVVIIICSSSHSSLCYHYIRLSTN
jgi:hypothetical protein